MIFKELILQNFGPYKGRQVVNLSPEKAGEPRPIILLGGMNGGGKTTLMDAIRLVFYGQRAQCSTRGNLSYGEFLNQCINHQTNGLEETLVELAFSHVKDNQNVIFRVRRRWTKDPKNVKETKDTLEVITDQWLDETITKTWDERVEYILPLGISNLFLFDGEQVKELAEQEAPPLQVREAIESLLGLELAERLSADLDILMARKRKEIADQKQRKELEELEDKIAYLQKERDQVALVVRELEKKVKKAQKNFDHHQNKFLTEGGAIASQRSQLDQNKKSQERALEQEREKLAQIAAGTLPLQLINPLLQEAAEQGKRELKQSKAIVAKEVIQERDTRLLSYLQDLALSSEQLTHIQDFLQQENQDLEAGIDPTVANSLGVDSETLNHLNTILQGRLPSQVEKTREVYQQITSIEDALDSLDEQLQTAASPEVYDELKTAMETAQSELVRLQTDWETQQRRYTTLDTQLAEVRKELANYGQGSIDRRNKEHLIESAAKVQETLKLFRERLTLKKLNKLEIEVTECFRYLLHKSDLVHRVAIATGDFSLSLYNNQGQPVPKHRLSAGEKQLLAIAFLWGLARVSGRHLPIAIDTPLGRLDSSHRHNLVERYFPSASSQVILLSTDTEIGQRELAQLREQDAIAQEYRLKYDPKQQQTTIEPGYFWS
ncbi:DNA sulfur modification protein DndD [Spirulina sp. CS-785/01]|uniref:DNA sulfur modification protein DndD n=1 Tax=Spirulina sp. CS-785/01 TaxID=3021716 RepID=UPI0023302553|nr:DNA sulfur modification protein DndD [Spirulina sp. CS-785/01]MDB9312807.1 DNA sulfur modification protein DndD [Spirulina sp. CS-785/01]